MERAGVLDEETKMELKILLQTHKAYKNLNENDDNEKLLRVERFSNFFMDSAWKLLRFARFAA